MFDGFGIYGQLDECHGHTHDHEIDGVMTYHYYLPTGFPYVIGCYKGCPEVSNNQMELSKFNIDATYGCPTGVLLIQTLCMKFNYISTSSVCLSSATSSIGVIAFICLLFGALQFD